MEFTFETQGPHTFLVYTVKDNDVIDSMSLGMLSNNKINGIASTQFTQLDTTKYIKYNISSHVSVKQVFSGTVNKMRLLGVFKGVANAILSAEEYMIDINSIIVDLDYIFTNVSTGDTFMICLPIENVKSVKDDLNSFFKKIMFSTQFDQSENCDYVATLINYLNANSVFSLVDFNDLLIKLENGVQSQAAPKKATTAQQAVPSAPIHTSGYSVQPEVQNINGNFAQQPRPEQPKIQPYMPPVPPAAQKPKNVPYAAPPKKTGDIPVPNKKTNEQKSANESNDEKISFFYLMQHYNKENAAAYKAQKEAKKQSKGITEAAPKKNKKNSASQNNFGFAIPGQASVPQPDPAPKQQPPVNNIPNVAPAQQQSPPYQQPANTPQSAPPPFIPRQVPQGQSINFGETTVLGGGVPGETTVLGAVQMQEKQINPHLIRLKNNERININKPVFRIGKERSYVDYFIGDNTAISRSHANIITRDDNYYIVDTNSTNHTFVNGNIIQSNLEVAISHGDKIRFGNEDFEFKLY